jgi:putative membrane protein
MAAAGCGSQPSDKLDNNLAETAETPGDVKRKNSQTNEEAAKNVTPAITSEDNEFAIQAALAGLTEVDLGKLATQRAKDSRVKGFGEMMVKDHSDANDKLRAIAEEKGITLADISACNKCQQKHDELADLNGSAFDKKYIDMMVQSHKEVSEKFSKQASNGNDPDLKEFAAKTLPVIKHHLSMVQAIQQGNAVKK